MNTLAPLLKQFQSYLLGESEDIAAQIAAPSKPKNYAQTRLAVYGDGYFLRLWGILKNEFPQLLEKMGEDAFEELIYQYVDTYPSRSPSVRYIGQHLSRFLFEQQKHELSDLAAFEWAISTAVDRPNGPVLNMQTLMQVPEAEWPALRFRLHPSVQQLTSHDKKTTIVWRKGLVPHYVTLNEIDAYILKNIEIGKTFEEICEDLCEYLPEEQIATYFVQQLSRWINEEVLSEIRYL